MRPFISCCFVVLIAGQIEAQTNLLDPVNDPDWSVLMQESCGASPDQIRTQFESRWAGRPRVKGSGYKQVERWLALDGWPNESRGRQCFGRKCRFSSATTGGRNPLQMVAHSKATGRYVARYWTTLRPATTSEA